MANPQTSNTATTIAAITPGLSGSEVVGISIEDGVLVGFDTLSLDLWNLRDSRCSGLILPILEIITMQLFHLRQIAGRRKWCRRWIS